MCKGEGFWVLPEVTVYTHANIYGNLQHGTHIREIWDLDDSFKELDFSGSVEELWEAAEENTALKDDA